MHGALTPKWNELQNIPKNGGAQIAQLAWINTKPQVISNIGKNSSQIFIQLKENSSMKRYSKLLPQTRDPGT